MATKKTSSNLQLLNAQIESLQAQAEALRKKEVGDIIAKAKEAIRHYGLTAADLGFGKATPKAGGAPAKPRKAAAKKPAAKSMRAPKFADDQGHSWGGIGKRPDWFKAALAAGKKPEDLLAKN